MLPYWCGYAEAKAAGLMPRKGSQAVRILRPQVPKGSDTLDSEPSQEAENGDSVRVSYRPVPPTTNARCRFRTSDILLVRQALYR